MPCRTGTARHVPPPRNQTNPARHSSPPTQTSASLLVFYDTPFAHLRFFFFYAQTRRRCFLFYTSKLWHPILRTHFQTPHQLSHHSPSPSHRVHNHCITTTQRRGRKAVQYTDGSRPRCATPTTILAVPASLFFLRFRILGRHGIGKRVGDWQQKKGFCKQIFRVCSKGPRTGHHEDKKPYLLSNHEDQKLSLFQGGRQRESRLE